MVNVLQTASDMTGIGGSSGGGGIGIGFILLILLFIILGSLIAGGIAWWLIERKRWDKKIVIFEKINGRIQPSRNDKGRFIKIGNRGDEVLLLKKHKKILPRPKAQTGVNTYWYEIAGDGEWINIEPLSTDEERGKLKMNWLDDEMRYARNSLAYMSKERYEQVSFLQKYGGLIAYTVLILITAIGLWLIIDKLVEVSAATRGAVESASKVLVETKKILGALDNLKGGTGIRPA